MLFNVNMYKVYMVGRPSGTVKTFGLRFDHILGCLSCISVTKECYQMSFLESSVVDLKGGFQGARD